MNLEDLVAGARPRNAVLTRSLGESAARVHVGLDLPAPRALTDGRPLVVAAEQLGVELRPATIYKLLILEALGRRGYDAVFLLEDRDVASKDKRLRGWSIPAPNDADPRRCSPVERSVTKAVAELPLEHVAVTPEYERVAAQLVTHYVPLVEAHDVRPLKATINGLMSSFAAAVGHATTLAELGRRQLVHVARQVGLCHVTFASTGAIEDAVLADDGRLLAELVPLADLAAAGLTPAGCAPYWGLHEGACHGRVRVTSAGQGRCTRCGEATTAWRPYSLRASVRMLLMQALGAALFVVGGTSGYNAELREFRHTRGEDYLPLVWQTQMAYVGPAQRRDLRVQRETTVRGASIVDALIAHGLDAGGDVAAAFVRLGASMREVLAAGVSYAPGCYQVRADVAA